jgi:hypothetical protein
LEPEKRTGLSAKFASFDGVQNLRPCARNVLGRRTKRIEE